MPLIQLIVLAIVQGITEFLPISSSAHLILAPLVVDGWADQGPLIDVAAHIGTLFAVLLYFRQETAMLWRGAVDTLTGRVSADRRLFLLLAAATVPIVAFAAVIVLSGLESVFRSPYVIATTSIVFGAVLWHADRRPQGKTGVTLISWREGMLVGLAQALSIVPGTSRSGITMTAARYLGWSRPEAARFSLLLAIPATAAFGAFAGLQLVTEGAGATQEAALIIAVLSFITAYLTLMIFMRMIRTFSFTPFVIYRILLGISLFAMAPTLK
ncbi:MAG: undecaprenyl-diphosphate phosphatase [Parvularculaceae bacterium]|nr:undecaprenyl-diphosphate phosphatase [Parvularculaceae bacterium]